MQFWLRIPKGMGRSAIGAVPTDRVEDALPNTAWGGDLNDSPNDSPNTTW